MVFTSVRYFLFLLVVVISYYLLPNKLRNYFLIIASLAFIGLCDVKTIPIIIVYSVIIYALGRKLGKGNNKILYIMSVGVSLTPLILCKGTSLISILGVAYFALKSASYLIDIKRGKCNPETNFWNMLLHIAFFPELLVGPIDRQNILLTQINNKDRKDGFNYVKEGILTFLVGCVYKMVIADRIAVPIDTVYGSLLEYEGFTVLLSALLYSLQVYFDFAGCSLMAIGTGKMLGYDLPVNFKRPYFALSVKELWQRWHLSLTSWLRDYIYIPLGGSRKGNIRKYINIIVVFAVSGLWHGVSVTYFLWGTLNGMIQMIEDVVKNITKPFTKFTEYTFKSPLIKAFKHIYTYLCMSACCIFFRAQDFSHAVMIYKKIFAKWNPWVLLDGTLHGIGLTPKSLTLLIVVLTVVLLWEIAEEKGINMYKKILNSTFIVQLLVYVGLIVIIALFGIYGSGYNSSGFIYMNF